MNIMHAAHDVMLTVYFSVRLKKLAPDKLYSSEL